MSQPQPPEAQIIPAPSRPTIAYPFSLFLAGTTTSAPGRADWRQTLADAIAHLPVTVFNPLRPDWDSTWREDVASDPFREQVEWELDMQERADLVVAYFGPNTDAPISLLELGLCARSGKALVVCHREYRKRGNVETVCRRYGVEFVDAEGDWVAGVVRRLGGVLARAD